MRYLIYGIIGVLGDEKHHTYEDDEEVIFWMNTIGPYHNRQETYDYYSLPFCRGKSEKVHVRPHENIGDALQGVELTYSGLEISYKQDVEAEAFCEIEVDERTYETLAAAVDNHYWYQAYIDDLPIWGIVGELDDDKASNKKTYHIWTHKKIEIGYNKDRIVEVNLVSENKELLEPNKKLEFSYEVKWTASEIEFKDRFDKYLDPTFFQHRIHWFSIFNSFMMVIFLVGLVLMILMRTLKKDYQRYKHDEESISDIERDLGDEYGWKQIHGDVFRCANYPSVLASIVSSGWHLFLTIMVIIGLAITEHIWIDHGELVTYGLYVYVILSPMNGYIGGSMYSRMANQALQLTDVGTSKKIRNEKTKGKHIKQLAHWSTQMIMGLVLCPVLLWCTGMIVNVAAVYYHTSRTIQFVTILELVGIEGFIVLPLHVVGTIIGRQTNGKTEYPCRINAIPKPIPKKKWYVQPAIIVMLAGLLPFGSIFIEMYFVFTSFWAYKIYYVYGFMFLVCSILAIVTICVNIVCIYFLLNSEDYRWQWTSFFSAASTAVYVYLYSIYYFLFKTKMYGVFQTTFYFSYMGLFCLLLGLMCGSIGYTGSAMFVKKIYGNVKVD